jgi:hypothetical protein
MNKIKKNKKNTTFQFNLCRNNKICVETTKFVQEQQNLFRNNKICAGTTKFVQEQQKYKFY